MELSTLNGKQSRAVNHFRLRILNRMTLAERVAEARGKVSPARFAGAIGISKAALSLIESGGTKTLRHTTALAIQRETGYRAEWVNHGTLPKKVADPTPRHAAAQSPREEMMLELFRGLTPEQQRELVLEVNAAVTGNREIQARFLNTPLRTFSNQDVEAAFGKVPSPAKSPQKPPKRRRPGFAEEDPE